MKRLPEFEEQQFPGLNRSPGEPVGGGEAPRLFAGERIHRGHADPSLLPRFSGGLDAEQPGAEQELLEEELFGFRRFLLQDGAVGEVEQPPGPDVFVVELVARIGAELRFDGDDQDRPIADGEVGDFGFKRLLPGELSGKVEPGEFVFTAEEGGALSNRPHGTLLLVPVELRGFGRLTAVPSALFTSHTVPPARKVSFPSRFSMRWKVASGISFFQAIRPAGSK
ncbi:MAG: hypothetical protein L6W00_08965 [Lentisphaeria bacterium]|nr:MAG: hypothetical protein L6W00_08965 [Lentisphaeria bacterium]